MKNFVVVVAVAILALWTLSHDSAAVSVTLKNSTYGTASTGFNHLELYGGNIFVRFIDSRGRLREADYILLSAQDFSDSIHFKNNTEANSCQNVETPWESPSGWRVWSKPGFNGTTLLGMNATYAQICEISMYFTLTDIGMDLRLANFTVPLRPDILKLSVIVNCPWKAVLLNQNLPFTRPNDTLTLYARHLRISIRMVFKFASQIIDLPKFKIGNLYDTTPPFGTYIDAICSNQRPDIVPFPDGRYPVQKVDPTFDFLDESGIFIATEEFNASMYFLGFSLSDDVELGRIIADGDFARMITNLSDGLFSILYNLSIPFANHTFYDPSLQLIFYDSESGIQPYQPPNVIEQVLAQTNTLAIILGVSMPLVVVIAVLAVILGVSRMKRTQSREFARVKNRLQNSQRSDAEARTVNASPDVAKESSPAKSEWKTASKTQNLKNVR